jgi:hypothetical protein
MLARSIAVFAALVPVCCFSQAPQADPNSSTSPSEQKIQFYFDQRVRTEDWNNIFDFNGAPGALNDDQREQMRYRTMFWVSIPVTSSIDFVTGINQETDQKLGNVGASVTPKPTRFDEIVFDKMYFDFKKLPVKGLNLRVGRQNLAEGEGFILFEGTPGDGSRTTYFNAVNLSYTRAHSKLELLGILDPSQDRFLPDINSQHKVLNDWDDKAVGAYYTDKNHSKTQFETYYFYKKEVNDKFNSLIGPWADITSSQEPLSFNLQPDRHISTFGGRVVQLITPTLTATGEFAYQWGAQHARPEEVPLAGQGAMLAANFPAPIAGYLLNQPMSALPAQTIQSWGGYGYLKKQFTGKWKPYVKAGYWVMSGSDPNKPTVDGNWDPIFSRWPEWSELYLYSQVMELGVGYTTNTRQFQGEVGIQPSDKLKLRATYYRMDAFYPYKAPYIDAPGLGLTSIGTAAFGNGTHRGDLFETRLDYIINKDFSGHITAECMLPGNFYLTPSAALFLQAEISYRLHFASGHMPKL